LLAKVYESLYYLQVSYAQISVFFPRTMLHPLKATKLQIGFCSPFLEKFQRFHQDRQGRIPHHPLH